MVRSIVIKFLALAAILCSLCICCASRMFRMLLSSSFVDHASLRHLYSGDSHEITREVTEFGLDRMGSVLSARSSETTDPNGCPLRGPRLLDVEQRPRQLPPACHLEADSPIRTGRRMWQWPWFGAYIASRTSRLAPARRLLR
jgi:hypothetical protein